MNYLEFFNEKMKKALLENPRFVELDEKRKHYAFLRNDIKENFPEFVEFFSRNSNKIEFDSVSTFISNTNQYLDRDYEDDVYFLQSELSKDFRGASFVKETKERLQNLQDRVAREKAFSSKYDKEHFFHHYMEEKDVVPELTQIENATAKRVLAESLTTKELSDYATAIVSGKKLNVEQFEYLAALNNILTKEYSKVKEDDYKLNRQVQDLFEVKITDTEAEI